MGPTLFIVCMSELFQTRNLQAWGGSRRSGDPLEEGRGVGLGIRWC